MQQYQQRKGCKNVCKKARHAMRQTYPVRWYYQKLYQTQIYHLKSACGIKPSAVQTLEGFSEKTLEHHWKESGERVKTRRGISQLTLTHSERLQLLSWLREKPNQGVQWPKAVGYDEAEAPTLAAAFAAQYKQHEHEFAWFEEFLRNPIAAMTQAQEKHGLVVGAKTLRHWHKKLQRFSNSWQKEVEQQQAYEQRVREHKTLRGEKPELRDGSWLSVRLRQNSKESWLISLWSMRNQCFFVTLTRMQGRKLLKEKGTTLCWQIALELNRELDIASFHKGREGEGRHEEPKQPMHWLQQFWQDGQECLEQHWGVLRCEKKQYDWFQGKTVYRGQYYKPWSEVQDPEEYNEISASVRHDLRAQSWRTASKVFGVRQLHKPRYQTIYTRWRQEQELQEVDFGIGYKQWRPLSAGPTSWKQQKGSEIWFLDYRIDDDEYTQDWVFDGVNVLGLWCAHENEKRLKKKQRESLLEGLEPEKKESGSVVKENQAILWTASQQRWSKRVKAVGGGATMPPIPEEGNKEKVVQETDVRRKRL